MTVLSIMEILIGKDSLYIETGSRLCTQKAIGFDICHSKYICRLIVTENYKKKKKKNCNRELSISRVPHHLRQK